MKTRATAEIEAFHAPLADRIVHSVIKICRQSLSEGFAVIIANHKAWQLMNIHARANNSRKSGASAFESGFAHDRDCLFGVVGLKPMRICKARDRPTKNLFQVGLALLDLGSLFCRGQPLQDRMR